MLLQVIASTPPGFPAARLVRAANRAGHIGALDLEHTTAAVARPVLHALLATETALTVVVPAIDAPSCPLDLVALLGRVVRRVVLTDVAPERLRNSIAAARRHDTEVLVQVTSIAEAGAARDCGADALVVKGHESGGRVGTETSFILLQRVLSSVPLPLFVRGGIGLHTAAACVAAGARGVWLDWQLGLCEESELPEAVKQRLSSMDGSETAVVGAECQHRYRVYAHRTEATYAEMKALEAREALGPETTAAAMAAWRQAVEERAACQDVLFIGQDGCWADLLARRFKSVPGVCDGLAHEATRDARVTARLNPLREGGPLAQSHGTRFPIVQGPMTRVSDRADFALSVAEGGGLPCLALALMRGPELERLLSETKVKLGHRPWGIGILGFVPQALRDEQLAEVRKHAPPFAIIAGGRPDQARVLEGDGITSYLHVPSPELLRLFLQSGARRVIFEGHECGGHVGPRTSFVLWESMVHVIVDHLRQSGAGARADEYHVLFAGGIHDALSSAMVATLAAPLAERGVRVGVVLGTAYLFTREAVASGAVVEGFQQQAIDCTETVLLESGVGHATRCARTRFCDDFAQEKRRLVQQGLPRDEMRAALEGLNLGRLRIAAKGIARGEPGRDGTPTYAQVEPALQRREGMYMIGQVAALRRDVITVEDLHRDVSQGGAKLAQAFSRVDARRATWRTTTEPSDIAIVGLSCVLPKASSVQRYWHNIWNKVNAIEQVPAARWDVDLYFDADRRARDKIYSRWGGFLEDVAFDPVRYGMPPSSVPSIEPLQLVTLELVREALSDAGYLERQFDRERTCVIVGTGGGVGELGLGYGFRSLVPQYLHAAGEAARDAQQLIERLDGALPEWTEDSFAGLLLNVAAGRVANRFDLGGANYVVDAACATALAALRSAVGELGSGASDVAIVASADMMQSPFGYLCFSKTQALSPTGQCRTFDESANGIVISEGIAVLVLKRLEDAVQQGDRIYAVIKGIGASSDGRDKGLTAPRPAGQIRALERAYAQAGCSASTVGLIEAHGTGTVVGDRAEVESLTKYFGTASVERQVCALGSVKSMIGHTKCTAGFAGLIKAVLALHHKVLPPTIGITKPNPQANFDESPFYLNTEVRPWFERLDGEPRRAGVSAFGFGGTNFHVVLEEYRAAERVAEATQPLRERPAELFLWRSESADDILSAVNQLIAALREGAQPQLCDLAATVYWECGRRRGRHCLALVARSVDDLAGQLEAAAAHVRAGSAVEDSGRVYYSPASDIGTAKVAFLFPGQGSQRVNMLSELASAFPLVRATFEEADRSLGSTLGCPLTRLIFPPPAFTREDQGRQDETLKQTWVAQPALGAADIALARLLEHFGIHPDLVGGHSYGELVALAAAGALSFAELIRLSEARGRLIVEAAHEAPGVMAAIDADQAIVAPVVGEVEGVWIANLNSPLQTVISGTQEAVALALEALRARGASGRLIPVACAFHSSLVASAEATLGEALRAYGVNPPRIPVFSNTTAAPHSSDPDAIRRQLAEHVVKPVRFADEITAMYEAGARIFVEVGPGKVLTNLVLQTLRGLDVCAVALDPVSRNSQVHLVDGLARLAVAGVHVLAHRLFEGRESQPLTLARLVEQTKPMPVSPTTWVIRSGRAVPAERAQASETPALVGSSTAPLPEAPRVTQVAAPAAARGLLPRRSRQDTARVAVASEPAPSANSGGMLHANEAMSVQPTAREVVVPPNGRQVPNGTAERVLHHHHRLMSRFLQTHRSVMVSALGSQHRAASSIQSPAPTHHLQDRRSETHQLPLESRDTDQIAAAAEPDVLDELRGEATSESAPESARLEPAPASGQSGDAGGREAPNENALVRALVDVVSQRSGYPPEMLGLDLDLEADLGIDSIKRVEILAALQSLPLLPGPALEGQLDTLSKLNTLRAIVDWLLQRIAERGDSDRRDPKPSAASGTEPSVHAETLAPATVGPASGNAATDRVRTMHDDVLRAIVTPVDASELQASPVVPSGGVVLITDDDRGIASMLASRLTARGATCEILTTQQIVDSGPPRRHCNLLDLHDVSETVGELRRQYEDIVALVHLMPAGFIDDPEVVSPRASSDLELHSLFHLVKALQPDLAGGRQPTIVAATRLGGTFGVTTKPGDAFRAGNAAVCGFLKCVAREHPDATCRVVDFEDTASPDTIAETMLAEMCSPDGPVEVGYRGGRRIRLRTTLAPVSSARSNVTLDRNSVILVTGGARGITAEIALELADRFHSKLLLVGRTPISLTTEPREIADVVDERALKTALADVLRREGQPVTPLRVKSEYDRIRREREIRANLDTLRAAGASVEYHALDLGDDRAFEAYLGDIYERFGRLDGVIHGAGLIEDKLVRDKSPESFARVLRPKVRGALTLARTLQSASLQFLVFFSSIAARYGNAGQSDYAAANETLNKLAGWLDLRWPGRIVSINWGPWESTRGMVSPELASRFAAAGVSLVSSAAGRRVFIDELLHGNSTQAEVIWGGPGPEADSAPGNSPAPAVDRSPSAYPWLTAAAGVRRLDRRERSTTVVLETHPDRHPFLRDHQLDGRPTMPMAMVLELAAEVAATAWPDYQVHRIRNLQVLRGITYPNGERQTLRVDAVDSADGDDPRRIDLVVMGEPDEGQVFYRAQVELGRAPAPVPVMSPVQVLDGRPLPTSIAVAYQTWLFHGRAFAGIEDVELVGRNAIVARLRSPSTARFFEPSSAGDWLIDPVIVDSALQLLILWARLHLDQTPLPSRLACFHRFDTMGTGLVRCEAEVRHTPGHPRLDADIRFLDAKGRLLGWMEGMEVTCSRALNRLADAREAAAGLT